MNDEVAEMQAPVKERNDPDPAGRGQRDRRMGPDRRRFSYAAHLPERRGGRERRRHLTTTGR